MDEVAECDENDFEEIEARLYGEVYQSKDNEELHEEPGQVGTVHNISTWRSAFRYFKSPHVGEPARFEPVTEGPTVSYRGPMPPPGAYFREGTNRLFNAALNEFVRPDEEIHTRGMSEETKKHLFLEKKKRRKKKKKNPDQDHFYNKLRRNLGQIDYPPRDQQEQLPNRYSERYNFRQVAYPPPPDQQQPPQTTSTIFISDESDEDCIIVQDKQNDDINHNNETNPPTNDSDDDDDIIYIAPPPPVVITVDEDPQPPEVDVETTNDSVTKESPNDFLECCGSENGFNFGLHGSEFRNQMESVSPNKVPYDYETESSSSTMEPGRSFNNTVKTIVFNEVEFPKGDIFAEKNLGTFESLITTRREDDDVGSSKDKEEQSKGDRNDNGNVDSHSSSSESDYEVKDNSRASLPQLSFMDEGDLERKQGSDSEKISSKKKPAKKKKKKTKAASGDDDSTDPAKNKNDSDNKRNTPKNSVRKKRNDDETVNDTDATKKKKSFLHDPDDKNDYDSKTNTSDNPKRKKKSSETMDETAATIGGNHTPSSNPNDIEVEGNAVEKKSKNPSSDSDNPKKKKKSLGQPPVAETNVETVETTPQCVKDTKRKKKTSLNEPKVEVTYETTENVEAESSNEVIVVEGTDCPFEVIDSCESNDVDDTRDIIIVEDDLNLANCKAEFDVVSIQRGQSDDPSKWEILDIDRRLPRLLGSEDVGPRCRKCRHFGHYASRCPDKPGPMPCKLCGQTNHQEPRCPERQCRQCGQGRGYYSTTYCPLCAKYRFVNCNICHMRGHLDSACPDLWRRYHLTTDAGPLVTPRGPLMKPRDQQWCCGCARRGHLEHECNYYNRVFPPTTPSVMDYRDTFYDGGVSTTVPHDIPSLLVLDIPKPNVTDEDRIVVSIPTSSNLKIQIGGDSDGPSAPVEAKKWLPTHDDHNRDSKHMTRLFMSHPVDEIKKFLEGELALLNDRIAYFSPRLLRDKLFKIEKHKAEQWMQKDSRFWYRMLNMYMFGVHQCKEGKLHKNYIMKVLADPETLEVNRARRKTLLGAYSYIFGSEKHNNFNYFITIKRLIQKYDDAQASK